MRSPLGTLFNKTPVPYVSKRSSLAFPSVRTNNAEAQMAAMGAVGTLFSIVTRLTDSTAAGVWDLWRKAPAQATADRKPVLTHAALDLWDQPNKFMDQATFVEIFQQHLDLVGEAWWVVVRSKRSKIPLELWPVRPDRMSPIPHVTKFVAGYVYSSPDGEQVPLAVDEVIFLRMPNPLDIYRGMGPVQAILADLDANKYSAEWNRNFFLNSAEPGGIIEVDRRLSDEEFDELRDRWAEQHQGVSAAHRVALIESGMKWVTRTITQKDMQFSELRSQSTDIIREAYGMPKFALGDVEDVNRATAEASATWFGKQLTTPRLARIRSALNSQLLPLYGERGRNGVEFDFRDPVPANREADNAERTSKAIAAQSLVSVGYDPADVLVAVDLPPIKHSGIVPSAAPAEPRKPGPPETGPATEPLSDRVDCRLIDLLGRLPERTQGRLVEALQESLDA